MLQRIMSSLQPPHEVAAVTMPTLKVRNVRPRERKQGGQVTRLASGKRRLPIQAGRLQTLCYSHTFMLQRPSSWANGILLQEAFLDAASPKHTEVLVGLKAYLFLCHSLDICLILP